MEVKVANVANWVSEKDGRVLAEVCCGDLKVITIRKERK